MGFGVDLRFLSGGNLALFLFLGRISFRYRGVLFVGHRVLSLAWKPESRFLQFLAACGGEDGHLKSKVAFRAVLLSIRGFDRDIVGVGIFRGHGRFTVFRRTIRAYVMRRFIPRVVRHLGVKFLLRAAGCLLVLRDSHVSVLLMNCLP